jgi:hypothetical protein
MQTIRRLPHSGHGRVLGGCGLALLLSALGACGDGPVTLENAPVQAVPEPSYGILDVVQQLELESLPGPIPTYFSPGSRERAEQLQAWLRAADAFFQKRLKIAPPFSLAVLNEEHWAQVSPGPYGVPFVTFEEPKVVVLPALPELSVVTQIYSASRVGLPAGAAADLERIGVSYDEAVGQIVDLIGFHEVGHVYIAALGYHKNNTARWLEELLATYAAYSYLDVAQPSSIVVWNALSEALLGFVQPVSRSLDDFNELYIQGLGPATYGWFQSHFNLRDDLIVQRRPRATWFRQLAGTGLDEDTRGIPTSELLRRLRGFEPSFTEWAESSGLEYR